MEPNRIILIIKMSDLDQEYLEENRPENDSDPIESILGDELTASPEETLTSFLAAFQARGRYHLADLQLDESYLQELLTNSRCGSTVSCRNIERASSRTAATSATATFGASDRKRLTISWYDDVVDNTCCGSKVTVNI